MTKKDCLALADEFRPLLKELNDFAALEKFSEDEVVNAEYVAGKIEKILVRVGGRGNEHFDEDKFLGYLRGTHGLNGGKK